MKLVIIESPYKGNDWKDLERNQLYLRACIRDCINRGESPYASHRMLTDALDDKNPVERAMGIKAGLAWRHACSPVLERTGSGQNVIGYEPVRFVFYVDLNWSSGMDAALLRCNAEGITYEERKLPADDPFFTQYPRCG